MENKKECYHAAYECIESSQRGCKKAYKDINRFKFPQKCIIITLILFRQINCPINYFEFLHYKIWSLSKSLSLIHNVHSHPRICVGCRLVINNYAY